MKVALYHDDVTLARAVLASAQSHETRSRLFLVLEHDGVTGYGEIAPQPSALHGDPGLEEVLDALEIVLARLEAVVTREGDLPSWSRVPRLAATTPAALFAVAALEMAVLDRELRLTGRSISDLWPREHVALVQTTVSLLDDADWRIDDRVARVRVKSAPGALSDFDRERLANLRVPVLLDFNCSATSDDEVLEQVDAVRRVASLDAVEQPYDAGNLADHARLAARLDVTLSLDEGVRKVSDVTNVARYGAAGLLCVKPARVGGLANARAMINRARSLGLSAYVGGFFESPYARFVHRCLVENCVEEPSDVGDVEVVGDVSEVRAVIGGFGLEPSLVSLERARRRLESLEGGP